MRQIRNESPARLAFHALGLLIVALVSLPLFAATPPEKIVQIPFIGCGSDGQVGPVPAPHGKAKRVKLNSQVALRLAYFKMREGPGVIAPRTWHCFGTYGSSGEILYVTPRPINRKEVFSATWDGVSGPAIVLSRIYGDTSGRFTVAEIVARFFPEYRAFAESIAKENPPMSLEFEPFPGDTLNYKSEGILEYETPAGADGLGTYLLRKDNESVRGTVSVLNKTPDILYLSVRLPSDLARLTSAVIYQVETSKVDY